MTSQTWTRRYPPITLSLVAAMLIAVLVLPSTLNIPQTNPTTIAEYAPVPPEDDSAPDTTGNVSALGLGTSASLRSGTPLAAGDLPQAEAARRQNKQCLGSPPRQAEDPMSPPCVPFFEGNNGGATYQGVTKDEVRVVIFSYTASTSCNLQGTCSNGVRPGAFCDLDKPANTDPNCISQNDGQEHYLVKSTRPVVHHFNRRYQTYDRHVHVWMYAGNPAANTAGLRAQAAEIYDAIRPFAVVPFATALSDALAARRVMTFGGDNKLGEFQLASAYQKHSPFLFNFGPDIERWVDRYADYICTKVAGGPVSHTDGLHRDGSPMKNTPRKYAFMYTTDTSARWSSLRAFNDMVRPKLRECGIQPAVEAPFPVAGNIGGTQGDNTYAARNVAEMQEERVTTVLWFGGLETYTGHAADKVGFYPEIIIASDGFLDGFLGASFQNPNWFRHAWGPTPTLFEGRIVQESPAYQSCKDGDPNAANADCETNGILPYYRALFMAFKGIQAAGPRLTPRNVERGLRSIPSIASTHPMLASCYFDPGDYTCVKDSAEQWWDPAAPNPYLSGAEGCFRLSRGGRRFLPGDWPQEDAVFQSSSDPCSPVAGNANANTGQPAAPST